MATIKNSTCTRCKNLISPLAIYCEHCGCCFDTRIGLPRLVAKLFVVLLAFLLGSGIATYSLNVRQAVSEASMLSLPLPTPRATIITAPSPPASRATAMNTSEGIAIEKAHEAMPEELPVSREEFLRKEAELKATQEALAELQRYIKELNVQQAGLPPRAQPKMMDENAPSSGAPKNKMESSVIIRTPSPTPTPMTSAPKPESSARQLAP